MLDYDMSQRGSSSLYEYLYQCVRDDIVSGTIAGDEHLPSKRALAEHLGVSVITVEHAYDQLVAEGYIYSLPRRGFYASALSGVPETAVEALDRDAVSAGSADAGMHVLGGAVALRPDSEPLAPSVREAANLWSRSVRAVLSSEDEREAFSPAPAQGTSRLRQAIAAHVRGTRGINVDPDRIVIGAGAQLLDIMLAQLLGRDAHIAVEDPGYLRLTRMYWAMGCEVSHIALDVEGVRVDELAASGANVLHLMPSHQFPTGRVTSIARRYALLSWASSEPGRYLIEDDFDCEFRLAGRPIPSLASIDTAGRVIYTNTFSKSLSSALRLAYMVLPPELMERYNRELGFYSSTVSSLDQIALARLLETGAYERHVARVRKRAREVRDALIAAVRDAGAGDALCIEEADSGLHCVLSFESAWPESGAAAVLTSAGLPAEAISAHAWRHEHATAPDGRGRVAVRYEDVAAERLPEAIGALLARL